MGLVARKTAPSGAKMQIILVTRGGIKIYFSLSAQAAQNKLLRRIAPLKIQVTDYIQSKQPSHTEK